MSDVLPHIKERCAMIRAMEYIARRVNDEFVFATWIENGVPDGEIDENTTDEQLAWLCEPDTFDDICDAFMLTMKRARASGGLIHTEQYDYD